MTVNELTNIQGIYKINFPNGKSYIGLSKNIRTRILEHQSKDWREHPELPISRAIHAYGIQDVEILEDCSNMTREQLQEREIYWIDFYQTTQEDKGYNVSLGGDGSQPGWQNHQAKLTKEQLFELYDLLLNSTLTFEELGEKYELDRMSISRINAGTHYFQEGYDYPLRKERLEKYGLDNKHSAFYGKEEELEKLVEDLQHSSIPLKDLCIKYNVGMTTISQISQGKKCFNPNLKYPLRKSGIAQRREFSPEQMLDIKNLLENPNISMATISAKYSCDRKVISAINNGTRQHQDAWEYPLRKIKMKTGPKKV